VKIKKISNKKILKQIEANKINISKSLKMNQFLLQKKYKNHQKFPFLSL